MGLFCTMCGNSLRTGAKFCSKCGYRLPVNTAAPAANGNTRETLTKSNSPRSNANTNSVGFDTQRSNQRVPSSEETELLVHQTANDNTEIIPNNNDAYRRRAEFPSTNYTPQNRTAPAPPPTRGRSDNSTTLQTNLTADSSTKYKPRKSHGGLAVALVLIVIGILAASATVFFIGSDPENRRDYFLSNASKCVAEMNYEQAVSEFDKVLEADPTSTEAYIGKAKAYYSTGDTEKAIKALYDGFRKTGDDRIWSLLKEYLGDI